MMKYLKVQPLELPPPPDPINLFGIEDHLLRKQIAEELKFGEDIVEIACILPYGKKTKC